MARPAELLREAQFAFHNIGLGSTRELRYRVRAKRLANRVISGYPDSVEAIEAHEILRRVAMRYEPEEVLISTREPRLHDHRGTRIHDHRSEEIATLRDKRARPAAPRDPVNNDWRDLAQRIGGISPNAKRVLVLVLAAIFFTMPALLLPLFGIILFYALNAGLLKRHLDRLLPDRRS